MYNLSIDVGTMIVEQEESYLVNTLSIDSPEHLLRPIEDYAHLYSVVAGKGIL